MENEEYPALYQAADEASNRTQGIYLRCVAVYAYVSITGAGLAVYGVDSKLAAIIAAILFLLGLFLSILLAVKQYESLWYRTRAIAESIKTSTWRFMMSADPFGGKDLNAAKQQFRAVLQQVLQEHKDLAIELGGTIANRDQLTQRMIAVRQAPFQERLQMYVNERIREQRTWYAGRSHANSTNGRRWFWSLVVLQGAAVAFTIARVGWPDWTLWPTQVMVVAATSVLGWIQLKRYRELGTAYAVAAHEIGFAETEASTVSSDDALSRFVTETEGAFSREHTQWVVRHG